MGKRKRARKKAKKRRKTIPKATETEVLLRSRRRCCICYGLHRKDEEVTGQIAHLDRDPSNVELDNLAWMCLEHHAQYDSRTSQCKNLTESEVRTYREELCSKYSYWNSATQQQLLCFLADTTTDQKIIEGALSVARSLYAFPFVVVYDALTESEFEGMDFDWLGPQIWILQYMESWGLLTVELGERQEGQITLTTVKVEHKPVCKELASTLVSREDCPEDIKKRHSSVKANE